MVFPFRGGSGSDGGGVGIDDGGGGMPKHTSNPTPNVVVSLIIRI